MRTLSLLFRVCQLSYYQQLSLSSMLAVIFSGNFSSTEILVSLEANTRQSLMAFPSGSTEPMDRCFRIFQLPCLTDFARRFPWCLRSVVVTMHLVYAGVLFSFDGDFIEMTKKEPWYTVLYLLLFVLTLIQYFATSFSSPGYVLEAMVAVNERNVLYRNEPETSNQPASRKNGSFIVAMEGNQMERNISGSNATSWSTLVADLTWTCAYCNVEKPPRAKHCHLCDKCVLQFDHHCIWLGNCIGQGNHCRFWWYLCEETTLFLWTGLMYISYLKGHINWVWWQDTMMILLLITLSMSLIFLFLLLLLHSYLILTNETEFELRRRKRIPYLREIPKTVHPFSKGVRRNLYNFCCARSSVYNLEPLPSSQEIEEKSRSYRCSDTVTCSCY